MNNSLKVVLIVLAMLCFLIASLLGFGVLICGPHVLGWGFAGLVFLSASTLP